MKHKKKVAKLAGRIAHWESLQRTMKADAFSAYANNKPGSVNK